MNLLQTKQCARCGETKARSEFGPNMRHADRLESKCKRCNAAVARERYMKKRAEGGLPQGPSRPRRPLPEFTRDAGWRLRKDIERIERVFADDRFAANKQQVAAHLSGHLRYTAEVCQDLLSRLQRMTGE